jgi:hypothetical protein
VQAVGRAQPFQHLVAVADRHHDVEQHKVEDLRGNQFQRLLAVGRDFRVVMALAAQAADQQVAVVLDVVDNEDACGLPRNVPAARSGSLMVATSPRFRPTQSAAAQRAVLPLPMTPAEAAKPVQRRS